MTPARETINLAELERLAKAAKKAVMGRPGESASPNFVNAMRPDVVLRLVGALRGAQSCGSKWIPPGEDFLRSHGITDTEATT